MKEVYRLFVVALLFFVISACDSGEEPESAETYGTEDGGAIEQVDSDEEETESINDAESEVTTSAAPEESDSENIGADSNTVEDISSESSRDDVSEVLRENVTNQEENSRTYIYEEPGYINELVYYHNGDEVLRQTSESELSYETLNVSTEEEAREILEHFSEEYQNIEGIDHSIEYNENGVVEILAVDYTLANISEVASLEGSDFDDGAGRADFISMIQSEQGLLAEGYQLIGDEPMEETTLVEQEPDVKVDNLRAGDSVTIEDITFTLNRAYYTDQRNQFADIVPDNVLIVNVTVENKQSEDYPVGADFDLYVDGSKAHTYPVETFIDGLSPGRSITGEQSFAILGNPSEIELEFSPFLSFSGEKAIFTVVPE